MIGIVVAAWTWTLAYVSLPANPVWALAIAAMGGFALGIELVHRVEKSEAAARRRARSRLAVVPRPVRSGVVATAAWNASLAGRAGRPG
jgi:hypothetical protein